MAESGVEVIAYLKNLRYIPYLDKRLRIIKTYPFIRAIGGICDEGDIEYLASQPYIEHIAYGGKVFMLEDDVTVSAVNFFNKSDATGRNVSLCIMDTGIHTHSDLAIPKNRIIAFKDIIGGEEYPYDDNGHGTFVAGVAAGSGLASAREIKGVAPECNLVGVKVINGNGECGVFDVLDGMQWVLDNYGVYKIRAVCMSFGSEPLGRADPLERGAEVLIKNGISVICAAGNSGKNRLKSPGTCPSAITVGSVDREDKVAEFSSDGVINGYHKPEVYTAGVDIGGLSNNSVYTVMSGTSVSAPVVAGAVALLYEKYPRLLPWQIKQIILNEAKQKNGVKILEFNL